jgi:hypothetical protein
MSSPTDKSCIEIETVLRVGRNRRSRRIRPQAQGILALPRAARAGMRTDHPHGV